MRRMLTIAAGCGLSGALLLAGCSGSFQAGLRAAGASRDADGEPAFSPCFAGAKPEVVHPVSFEDFLAADEGRLATASVVPPNPVPLVGYFELPPAP